MSAGGSRTFPPPPAASNEISHLEAIYICNVLHRNRKQVLPHGRHRRCRQHTFPAPSPIHAANASCNIRDPFRTVPSRPLPRESTLSAGTQVPGCRRKYAGSAGPPPPSFCGSPLPFHFPTEVNPLTTRQTSPLLPQRSMRWVQGKGYHSHRKSQLPIPSKALSSCVPRLPAFSETPIPPH